MTQPIDRAFVDIEPNTRDFSRDLNRDVEKAYDKVETQTQLLSKKITKSFDAAGREIKRTFTSIAKDGVVATTIIEEAFDEAGDKIQRVFKAVTKSGVKSEETIAAVAKVAADSAADSFERAGERIEDAFREASRVAAIQEAEIAHQAKQATDKINGNTNILNKAFSGLFETIVSLGSALVGLGAAAPTPAGLVAILATITAIAAATGPIIALVGALADLIGLIGPLPAALGVLVAAIVPLVFAFQGLGDAIKAVNEGDPEKIAKAMKNLAPAARSVVKEITGLNKVFDTFRKSIQQSFFAPIVGDIGQTVRILLPSLQKAIDNVAGSLGRLAENFLAFLQQPTTIKTLNNLFNTTARIIEAINVPLVNLLDTFLTLVNAGLPFIERFSDAFGKLLEKFGAFVDASVKSGAFNDFVEDAIATTKKLLDLVGALGNLFGALFSNADDEGRDFIQTLTDGVNALADFFRTAEGQRTIQDFIDSIKITVATIGFLFVELRKTIEFLHFTADAWQNLGRIVSDAAGAIGRFFVMIGQAITIGFTVVVNFFRALPGQIMSFIKSIPQLVLDLFNFLFDELNRRIGIGIALIIFTFTQLPKLVIDAVRALPELLGDLFSAAWTFAKTKTLEGITAVINFVKSIPGRITALVGAVSAAVSSFFTRIFAGGKKNASSAFDAIVGFFKNLPSRLGAFVTDVGGRIGDAIKRVLNRAIDKINAGIGQIDDILPGNLPRIPNLAAGAIVKAKPGGTIARLAEAGQDEIVGPLKDVAKLFQRDEGTTITFGPGSVQVMFEGAVPTESQARTVGNAVGLGIIDSLMRRNIRTTIRAL